MDTPRIWKIFLLEKFLSQKEVKSIPGMWYKKCAGTTKIRLFKGKWVGRVMRYYIKNGIKSLIKSGRECMGIMASTWLRKTSTPFIYEL